MRTIAICNFKGGVGKTVTCANLAAILAAEHKKRVLLIDADAQGNLSQFFGAEPEGCTTLELLQSGADYYPDFVTATASPGIDIIPADDSLMLADIDAFTRQKLNLQQIAQLREVIEEDGAEGYDYLLIDCPPALSAASSAALMAADEVIIPIKLDAFSTAGMTALVRQIDNMRRINSRLRVAGCLATMYYPSETIREAEKILRQAGTVPVFRTVIRRSNAVDVSTFAKDALRTFSPNSAASRDYRRFANELVERGRRHG